MRRLEKVVSMAENELKQLKDNLKLTHDILPYESSVPKTNGPSDGSVINNMVETFVDSITLDLSCNSSEDYLKTISERTETDINSEPLVFNINLVPCNPFSTLCKTKVLNMSQNSNPVDNPGLMPDNSSKQMSDGVSSIVILNDQSTGPVSSIIGSDIMAGKSRSNTLGTRSSTSSPQSVVESPPHSLASSNLTFRSKTNSFAFRPVKKKNNTKTAKPNIRCNCTKYPFYSGYLCKDVSNTDSGTQEMATSDYIMPPENSNLENNCPFAGCGYQPPIFPPCNQNNLYSYAQQQSIPNIVKQAITKKGKLEITNSCNHMQFICNNRKNPGHVEVFITKTPEDVFDNSKASTNNKEMYSKKIPTKPCNCGVKPKLTSFQTTAPVQHPGAVTVPKSLRLPPKCRCVCTKKIEPQKPVINKTIQTSQLLRMDQPTQATTNSANTVVIDRRKEIMAKCAIQILPGVIIESTISLKRESSPTSSALDLKVDERRPVKNLANESNVWKEEDQSSTSIEDKAPERNHTVEAKLVTDIPSNRSYPLKQDHNDDIFVLLDQREMCSSTCATNATESTCICTNYDADTMIAQDRDAGTCRRRCKSCGCIKDINAAMAYKKPEVANHVERKQCVPNVTCISCANLCKNPNCKPNKTCDICESVPKVCCAKSKCCKKGKPRTPTTPKYRQAPIPRGDMISERYPTSDKRLDYILKGKASERSIFSYAAEPPKWKKEDKLAYRDKDESAHCSTFCLDISGNRHTDQSKLCTACCSEKPVNRDQDEPEPFSICCSSRKTSKKCTCPRCDLKKTIKPCKGNCRYRDEKYCSESFKHTTHSKHPPETPEGSGCCASCKKKKKVRMCDNRKCASSICNAVEHASARTVSKQSTQSSLNPRFIMKRHEPIVYKMEQDEPKPFETEFLAQQTEHIKVAHCTPETLGLTGDALSESTLMDGSILNSSDKYVIVHDVSAQVEAVDTDEFNMSFSSYMGCGSPKRTASLDEFLNVLDSPHLKPKQDLGLRFDEEYEEMISPRQCTNAFASSIIVPTNDREEETTEKVEPKELITISPVKPKRCGFLTKKNDILSKSKHFDWKIMRRKKLKSPKDDTPSETVSKSINQRSLCEEIISSDGETNCSCSVSIGEVHECKRLLGTKVDQKNGKIVKTRPEASSGKPRYNKNVVSYYISTSSSVNDSMK